MGTSSILPLVAEWETFITEQPGGNLHQFAVWLLQHLNPVSAGVPALASEPTLKSGQALSDEHADNEEYLAAFYVGRLSRYVKAYVKPLLHESGLTNPDEFSFLSLIDQMHRPTKREVCIANVTELSTGQDIIRRLLRAGWVQEQPDERDARAKRLLTTEKGKELLQAVYLKLANLEQKVMADVSLADKKEFLRVLKYLNNYHFQVYAELTY